MIPTRYAYFEEGSKITITDSIGGGSLLLIFKPLSKKAGSMLMTTVLNDIVTELSNRTLGLTLVGHSTITIKHDMELKGLVHLKSSHLHDPVIINSKLHFISLRHYTKFKNSTISFLGSTNMGELVFDGCRIDEHSNFNISGIKYAKFANNQRVA